MAGWECGDPDSWNSALYKRQDAVWASYSVPLKGEEESKYLPKISPCGAYSETR